MNIQLRDSKKLQTELTKLFRTRTGRADAVLPKPQLHPELLYGFVDTDGGGFVVRSADPGDQRHLEWFMPEEGGCEASWTMSGTGENRIPSELVFNFGSGGKLVLRTQHAGDITKLTSVIPSDQRAKFHATFADGRISLAREGAPRPRTISAISDAELRTQCGINGVKWDAKASRETMLERLAEAIEKKGAKEAKPEPEAVDAKG